VNPTPAAPSQALMPEIARQLHPFWLQPANAMYATDTYPCDNLRLQIVTSASGKARRIVVMHPDKETPLEQYFCASDQMVVQTVSEWLARHPLKGA